MNTESSTHVYVSL